MNHWNNKASTYSRYSQDKERFEHSILKTLDKNGITFKDKTVVDIGCGTGVYTLHVAQDAKRVTCIDNSSAMLDILGEDAKKIGIENLNIVESGWEKFHTCKDDFDIALCTMSPAISEISHMQKMHECAQTKIYLGWAGKRKSTILDEIFQAHKSYYKAPNGAQRLSKWLQSQNIDFKRVHLEESRKSTREFEKSVKNFIWHLQIRKVTPDESLVRSILENHQDVNGNVTEITNSKIDLIFWK